MKFQGSGAKYCLNPEADASGHGGSVHGRVYRLSRTACACRDGREG
jgi:hypothetical protein